jgi:hypothetical protein
MRLVDGCSWQLCKEGPWEAGKGDVSSDISTQHTCGLDGYLWERPKTLFSQERGKGEREMSLKK